MPYTLRIDPRSKAIIGKVTGPITIDEMKACVRESWARADWGRQLVLWDVTEGTFSLTEGEMRDLATFTRSGSRLQPPARMSFAVASDVEFGQVRMFEVFRTQPGVEIRVFRDYDQAYDWLMELAPPITGGPPPPGTDPSDP